jgi:uncharacterized coiled-coil protein SlyX
MSIEIAKKVLEEWFARRGLRLEYEGERELVLIEGNNKVYVRISSEEFPTESYIIDELSAAMKNRLKYNKAYIAFPRNARGLINGKLFKSHWVGVYLYDVSSALSDPDRAVEELIPSIPIQLPQGGNEEIEKRLSEIEKTIAELRSAVDGLNIKTLMRDVAELREKLLRMESTINDLINRVSRLERVGITAANTAQVSTEGGGGGELPDFLSDNPWIEVLRRRGGGSG